MGINPLAANIPLKSFNLTSKIPSKWQVIVGKVQFVFFLVVKIGAGVLAFAINPTIFSIGLIVGIAFQDQVTLTINKIIIIWKKQSWPITMILCGGMFLSLPVTFAATSILYAGYIGSTLTRNAMKQWKEPMPLY